MSPAPQPSSTRPGASSSMVAIEEAVTEGWRVTGLVSRTPRPIARGRLSGGREQDVGVAAAQLRIRQPGDIPAERLDPRDIGRERSDRAGVLTVEAELRDPHERVGD